MIVINLDTIRDNITDWLKVQNIHHGHVLLLVLFIKISVGRGGFCLLSNG